MKKQHDQAWARDLTNEQLVKALTQSCYLIVLCGSNKIEIQHQQIIDLTSAELIRRLEINQRLIDSLEEINIQANGHKRSVAYNDGINIALENIENIAYTAVKEARNESN